MTLAPSERMRRPASGTRLLKGGAPAKRRSETVSAPRLATRLNLICARPQASGAIKGAADEAQGHPGGFFMNWIQRVEK